MTLAGRLEAAARRAAADTSDYDLNPGAAPPEGRVLRDAAVLVGVRGEAEADARVILTRRSPRLRHHPGQIAFPGGKRDPGDADAEACALREAGEEVGLHPADARILGRLRPHETVTGFLVTPVVAAIAPDFVPRPEIGEVAEVFEVPLAHLLSPRSYTVERRLWRGGWRRYYAVPWGPHYIWGATARILKALAEAWDAGER